MEGQTLVQDHGCACGTSCQCGDACTCGPAVKEVVKACKCSDCGKTECSCEDCQCGPSCSGSGEQVASCCAGTSCTCGDNGACTCGDSCACDKSKCTGCTHWWKQRKLIHTKD